MYGLCDARGCKKKASDGSSRLGMDTEFIIQETKDRFVAHIDLCPEHGHEIPIRVRKYGAISIDNIDSLKKSGPFKKYREAIEADNTGRLFW